MENVLPGVTTNLTHFYRHFFVTSQRLLICLLSYFHREKCWKYHSSTLMDARKRSLGSWIKMMMMCVLCLLRYLSCWNALSKKSHTEQEKKQVAFGQQVWFGWGAFALALCLPFSPYIVWAGGWEVKSRRKQPLWCHFPPFPADF